ncbi:Ubiquitin-conjugating enzyme E2 2 [Spraguea lophii 42_110]|uniref:Ubiquitin-conjugating enzyme E2 2 n=1 Tax=Spraguea lophii (strain 42_110) TaxID=1358809 RepID=S7XJE5_SPRLO|nr:Ubiquitin-conjugating enzyme E2 2 [Spraguea lophii 42_110]
MSTPAKRRLMKDFKSITDLEERSVFASPLENDLLTWCAIILGPEDTPFQNGTFSLLLEFEETFPATPPNVKFISKMFHPNIYKNGELCLDILKNKWTPNYDIFSVLLSIQSLLNDPNVNSPANTEAAEMYSNNKDQYFKKVKEMVEDSWTDIDVNEQF